MITCPECGQAAPDGAKFCDRCGQGLSAAAAAPPPATRPLALKPGAKLKGVYEIVEVVGQTSIENRYRVKRDRDGQTETLMLRERFGPGLEDAEAEAEAIDPPQPEPPAPVVDPNGPQAKTAELKPIAPPPSETNGASSTNGTAPEADAPRAELHAAPESQATTESGEGVVELAEADTEPLEAPAEEVAPNEPPAPEDLGEVFGRVLALSMTLTHPAFQRALAGFADDDRVYLVYADEQMRPVHRGAKPMSEADAIAAAIQVCQAISFVHRRGLRLNDICPESVLLSSQGRIKITGLDYVSNDNELQSEPIFNDGYTAPEIYRSKRTDKRADVFSAGALLYSWLTAERIPSESWREEASEVRFYPPHVLTPKLEQAIRRAIAFDSKDRWPTIDDFKGALTSMTGNVRLRAAAMTDVGIVREHNEDSVMAVEYVRESLVDPAQNHLFVVADGMGGAEAGEVASAIAVATIRDYVETALEGSDSRKPEVLLAAALEAANQKILDYVAAHQESRGMGSTAVGALVLPPDAAVAWVGDSRAYFLDSGQLRQVTKDHSLVQRLVDIGQITAEEARTHEHKNVITRSLGARQTGPAGAEAIALKLKRGDRLLLCSDGLTAHVDDNEIAMILTRHGDPYDAARELVVAANAGGGTDNVSVVVVFAS
ncbi:MAG TPA: Stp1/IreP family PP2C-type Ser/Thr phosphatase [Candidatus Binataceae bacterium]|nr:Stp1/IreP family PP2C-type Ser/Thr phosphatase [Candidatus Binataceae bacterium]